MPHMMDWEIWKSGWYQQNNPVVGELPVVEGLLALLAKIHSMKRGDAPFSTRSFYDEVGKLNVAFGG
jgi:hypothetical protein